MKAITPCTRRMWLSRLLAAGAGAFAASTFAPRGAHAASGAAGFHQGIVGITGTARVNGVDAAAGTPVGSGDEIVTAPGSSAIVVLREDAMLVRAGSRIVVSGPAHALTDALTVVTGAVLAVFAPGRPRQLRTATATIGIRGTAGYVEVQRDRTYVCICYGTADLAAVDDPAAAETVTTTHHDEPRYIYRRGMPAMIASAPVVNHTDDELAMLEGLVGRRPAFYGRY